MDHEASRLFIAELILLLGLLPTALAADGEETGEKLEYGEPVGFTVEIEGEKRICFMGVGQLINGKYDLLSGTTMAGRNTSPARCMSRSASGG